MSEIEFYRLSDGMKPVASHILFFFVDNKNCSYKRFCKENEENTDRGDGKSKEVQRGL